MKKARDSLESVGPIQLSREVELRWQNTRFLVLVNPVGGKRLGRIALKNVIEPTLSEASIDYDVLITQHANHAHQYIESTPNFFQRYNVVLIFGGDGMIHQVVNGLFQLKKKVDNQEELSSISIGVLPGGTGNGIANSLGLSNDIRVALERTLNATEHMIDVFKVKGNDNLPPRYCLMSFNFGLVGEADELLEQRYRWLGPARDILIPLYLIVKRPLYRAKIVIEPSQIHYESDSPLAKYLSDVQSLEKGDRDGTYLLSDGNSPVFFFTGSLLTHISYDMHCCPLAKTNDGCIDVIYQTDSSPIKALQMFMEAEDGIHVEKHAKMGLRYFKLNSFTIIPDNQSSEAFSTDGELLKPTSKASVEYNVKVCTKAKFLFPKEKIDKFYQN